MIRNFVTGIVVGGVVAAVGLGVVSQMSPLPGAHVAQRDVASPAPEVTNSTESATTEVAPTTKPAKPVETAEPEPPAATPVPAVPESVTPEPVVPAEPAPPVKPADMAEPAEPATTESPAAADPAKPAPQPEALAEAPAAPVAPATARPAPEVQSTTEAVPGVAAPGTLPASAGADAAPAASDLPPPAPVEPPETLLDPAPAAEPATPATITLDPAPAAEAVPAVPKLLDTEANETLAPSTGLSKTADGVTTGRLPSIAAPEAGASAAADAVEVAPQDDRPISRYARVFGNDAGKPLFAVVLLDTGAADLERDKLAALPFAVTFAIDPLDPGAAAAAAIYRAAGQEVVMLASGIPEGATASDLEQTFQSNAGVLPEAVAVMDIGSAGFQDNRPLATLVVPVIAAQGRGVLTFDKGLNAADQVARREGVPAAVIFRDLDAEGEDTPVIRRYLDRAAFKAAQEGRVVVMGTTRPETIAALMEWTLEGRAASVALAPITAVMAVK